MPLRLLSSCVALLAASTVWAHGGLVATESVELEAARTVVVRHPDKVQFITQLSYAGQPAELVWLLAIPNFNDPTDDGVRVTAFGQPSFDELDEQTRPLVQGECDGMPDGSSVEVLQLPGWGPAPQMALPSRIYNVPEVLNGDLAAYLGGLGINAEEEALAGVVSTLTDQNFMFVAVRITAEELGVPKVAPTVSIEYPLGPGEQPRVALVPTSLNATAGPADMVFWVLGEQRYRFNLTTEELSAEGLAVTGAGTTNYTSAFDQQVGANQTQTFITEYAAGLDNFADPALTQLVAGSGAVYLTRLRGRLSGPALRANFLVDLRGTGMAPVAREVAATGQGCGDMPDPDMGIGPQADAGDDMPDADMGISVETDTGPDEMPMGDGSVRRSGGGGGGSAPLCSARPGQPGQAAWPLLLLFLLLPARARR